MCGASAEALAGGGEQVRVDVDRFRTCGHALFPQSRGKRSPVVDDNEPSLQLVTLTRGDLGTAIVLRRRLDWGDDRRICLVAITRVLKDVPSIAGQVAASAPLTRDAIAEHAGLAFNSETSDGTKGRSDTRCRRASGRRPRGPGGAGVSAMPIESAHHAPSSSGAEASTRDLEVPLPCASNTLVRSRSRRGPLRLGIRRLRRTDARFPARPSAGVRLARRTRSASRRRGP